MTKEHVAASHPFTNAIVAEVVKYTREFKRMDGKDSDTEHYDLWTGMLDHLKLRLAPIVAEWELSGSLVFTEGNDDE